MPTITFSPNDQRRIVRILGLHRDQRLPGSRLRSVMDIAEQHDALGAVGLVEDIVAILDAIDSADEVSRGEASEALGPNVAASMPDGIERLEIKNEVEIIFQPGANASDGATRTRAANVARLRQLLDPDKQLMGVTEGGLLLW